MCANVLCHTQAYPLIQQKQFEKFSMDNLFLLLFFFSAVTLSHQWNPFVTAVNQSPTTVVLCKEANFSEQRRIWYSKNRLSAEYPKQNEGQNDWCCFALMLRMIKCGRGNAKDGEVVTSVWLNIREERICEKYIDLFQPLGQTSPTFLIHL